MSLINLTLMATAGGGADGRHPRAARRVVLLYRVVPGVLRSLSFALKPTDQ